MSEFVCGSEFVVAGETLCCERPPGHLGGHACPSAIGKRRAREIAAERLVNDGVVWPENLRVASSGSDA